MRNFKRLLAAAVALTSIFAMSACGESDSSEGEETYTSVETVPVEDTSAIEDIAEDAKKEIVWMGTYDLNPTRGADKSVEMTLFNNKGGSVKWNRVADDTKFDSLATAILSKNDVPDIFKYEWLAFPSQVLKDMYQPVDSIVDFDDDLWKDVKPTAEQFVMNGKHYVAPISYAVGTLMMYDNAIIENENLDDPYELWLNDEWDWDAWYDMMDTFVSNATGDDVRYGINGWFQTQIVQQTGKTMVIYEDGVFKSNLMDPDIERAEDLLYKIGKNGYVNTEWLGNAKNALKDGNILFYCMGPWALTGTNGPGEDDDYGVVPMPEDPNTDGKYVTSDMTAYMWVKYSTASEAVKTWFECCRIAATDEQYIENGRQKFMNANPAWTEDMYDVYATASSTEYLSVFDYGYGISPTMSSDSANADGNCITRKLYEYTNKQDENGQQYTWNNLRETYGPTVDAELKTINDAIATFEG